MGIVTIASDWDLTGFAVFFKNTKTVTFAVPTAVRSV